MGSFALPSADFYLSPPGLSAERTPAEGKPFQEATESLGSAKLRKAAQDFESILIHTWWRSMTESFASSSEEGQDPAHGTLEDLSMQAMSTALAASGGMGIARMLIHAMEPLLDRPQAVPEQETGKGPEI